MRYGEIINEAMSRYFKLGNWGYFAFHIAQIEDPVARQHVAQWFASTLEEDNPKLSVDDFIHNATTGALKFSPATALPKHGLEYLATEISLEQDPHVKAFLTHWLGDLFEKGVYYFDRQRWDRHCATGSPKAPKIPRDSYQPTEQDKLAWQAAMQHNVKIYRNGDGSYAWTDAGEETQGYGFSNKWAAAADALRRL